MTESERKNMGCQSESVKLPATFPANVEGSSFTKDDSSSLDSTPIKDMPSPSADETAMFRYVNKIAYLILNNLPLRLKHLIKLRKLREVRVSFSKPN